MARLVKLGDKALKRTEVRVVTETSEQLGVMNFEDALYKAKELGLDLAVISPKAKPPVCRIMNFGKHQYEEKKKKKEAKKKQHQQKLKEVKFRPNVEEHDYSTKVNRAIAFLEKGDKVKVSMFFRGREMAHKDIGFEVINRVLKDTAEVSNVDTRPRFSGRMIVSMLSPKSKKK